MVQLQHGEFRFLMAKMNTVLGDGSSMGYHFYTEPMDMAQWCVSIWLDTTTSGSKATYIYCRLR